MDIEFHSLEELKKRIMPAIRVRKRELRKSSIPITEEELWNYFVNNYWKNATNLSLAKMVDNVLNDDVVFRG